MAKVEVCKQLIIYRKFNFQIKLEAKISEILWLGEAWICCKQLKHYPAFCRNEIKIPVSPEEPQLVSFSNWAS